MWSEQFWSDGFWSDGFWGFGTAGPPLSVTIGRRGTVRFGRRARLRMEQGTVVGIAHLLDHTMRVWRPVGTTGEKGQLVRTYELVYASLPCAANRQMTQLTTEHGGLVPAGVRRIYLDVGPVIMERDVCELVTGPEAPARCEVEAPSSPRGHHIELGVTEFNGKLPAVEQVVS